MNKFLVNYQGFYKVFRKMPVIIFWLVFTAGTIAGIAMASAGGFLGGMLAGAVAGFLLAALQAIAISPIIIITDSMLEKK